MQFHQNGFRTGDPALAFACHEAGTKPREMDVLIVGSGPAGLTLATQLSVFPEISLRVAERKPGPLEVGQADGIACRSMEMFEAFGFAEKVTKEGYWVNEVAFWRPGNDGTPLIRANRIQDVEDDLSEMPHVILSQARIHDFYLELMRNSPRRLTPDYGFELTSLTRTDDRSYPVTATFDRDGEAETLYARYVIGCDGAGSRVRKAIGRDLQGNSARQLWGVMDVLVVTDFPDIRLKCAIQSADAGSVLIIPREGGYMVRLYIELAAMQEGERVADRGVTSEMLIAKAQQIMSPYVLKVTQVAWWSAYEIGQRICDAFDDVSAEEKGLKDPRIFIAGDACHTHSPKAGQGMNVSMADAFNLGWKLAAVLRGQAGPALLDTYSDERWAKAKELIDFDRDMARLFSAKSKTTADAERFQHYFKKHGRYTAGVETRYTPSLITGRSDHQDLAKGFVVGKRFHSAPVIRIADAKPMQLGHVLRADGRWRIIVFAPETDSGAPNGSIAHLCEALAGPSGLIQSFTPDGSDIDSVFDVRAVFQLYHRDIDLQMLPKLLLPTKGVLELTDYEKVFCPDMKEQDIFHLRGIDRARGAVVVIRPDQYVAQVVPLAAVSDIEHFFRNVLRPVGSNIY